MKNRFETRRNRCIKTMERKTRGTILLLVPIMLMWVTLASCGRTPNDNGTRHDSTAISANKSGKVILYWYDPMNPTVRFDHPGKSPFMGMDLEPMYAEQNADDSHVISVDPAMVQDIGVVTAKVVRRRLTRTIHTYGAVVPDEKTICDINTRVSGWIEQLYFDNTGMKVRKGQPMAVIYSPELIAAEQEFLQSMNFGRMDSNEMGVETSSLMHSNSLIQSARERLAFFGMDDKEIDDLQAGGRVMDRVVINSTAGGFILEKHVFAGQKIISGETLFRVADLRSVWVLADVFNIDLPFLKLGSHATVNYNGSDIYHGFVDFIYPEVDATARSVKVRISLLNRGMGLKVDQYVDVAIKSSIAYDAVAVPAEAVINTGMKQIVVVALGGGKFEIREVTLGAYADGYYEVTSGLTAGEEIVTSGQFLLDSDANLKSAGAAMSDVPGVTMTGMEMSNASHDKTHREK